MKHRNGSKQLLKYPPQQFMRRIMHRFKDLPEDVQGVVRKSVPEFKECFYYSRQEADMTLFIIMLPNGIAFSGFAIRTPNDNETPANKALMVAVGRACGCVKAYQAQGTITLKWMASKENDIKDPLIVHFR